MSTNITVNCSGALFTSLQFHLINHKKIQEGFLLGQIEKFTLHSISDSEIHNENVNVAINLTGYIPCTAMGTFYSGCGRVNFEYLKQTLQHNLERVVGWYHSRRMSETVFLKEMRIHEQLREGMPHTDGHFLFALFSRLQPSESGTMDVNYKFQIMLNNNEFEGVPLRINNMSDTSTSQYIRAAPCSALYSSRSLQDILGSFATLEPGIKEAEQLHNGLLNQLRILLPKYAHVQEQHHKMLQIVNKLQEFCHRSEINPNFQPNQGKECDFDLMDLESPSPKMKKKQSNPSVKSDINVSKNVGTPNSKKSDPFGFVEREMEKHQENDLATRKASPKVKKESSVPVKSEREKTIDPKMKVKSKMLRKNSTDEEPGRVLRNTISTSKVTHSPNSSPSRKNSPKEANALKNHTSVPKTKSLRGAKLNSVEESSLPSARRRSPSTGTKATPKLKEKETWTDNKMLTDSPEY